MGKLGKALSPVIMAAAIAVEFGMVVFLTAWHGSDCRSAQRSISIGGAVLLAGCGGAR